MYFNRSASLTETKPMNAFEVAHDEYHWLSGGMPRGMGDCLYGEVTEIYRQKAHRLSSANM